MIVGYLIAALSVYSYFLIRRAGYVRINYVASFVLTLYNPKVLETLTVADYDEMFSGIRTINFRILICYLAAIIGIGAGLLYMLLVFNQVDGSAAGIITGIAFAYLVANYDINTKSMQWIRDQEDKMLTNVIAKNASARGYDNLHEYLHDENVKLWKELFNEAIEQADEFNEILEELGFDFERDYDDDEESREEFISIMVQAEDILQKRIESRAETHEN